MDSKYFTKLKFSENTLKKYLQNSLKDLKIAKNSSIPEVKFNYSYNALLKAGITIISKLKGMKVRSIQGHHIAILKTMSELLKDDSIFTVCNAMRIKRNTDLYDGGILITEKESDDYFDFAESIIKKTEALFKT